MSMQEDNHSGIPTRAIHDAYLDMQRALNQYREARDKQHGHALDDAHGQVQSSVLTFYELLRPHLKKNQSVRKWWNGKLPPYPSDGSAPDPDDGKGVLQVQKQHINRDLSPADIERIEESNLDTLEQWHDILGLNGNIRILGVRGAGDGVFLTVHQYQLGLKHLDDWGTTFRTTQSTLDGFYGGKTQTKQERQRVDMGRLKRASRELGEVAEELQFLSDTGTPTNDDTRPI